MRLTFDHVHIFAADMDAMAAWLEEMLDGRIVGGIRSAERPRVDVDLGGLRLFVSPPPRSADRPARDAAATPINHLAFEVADVDETVANLVAKGVVVIDGPSTTRPGLRTAFIEGPEGLTIELLRRENVSGSATLEGP